MAKYAYVIAIFRIPFSQFLTDMRALSSFSIVDR